jgi:hypothetical protein
MRRYSYQRNQIEKRRKRHNLCIALQTKVEVQRYHRSIECETGFPPSPLKVSGVGIHQNWHERASVTPPPTRKARSPWLDKNWKWIDTAAFEDDMHLSDEESAPVEQEEEEQEEEEEEEEEEEDIMDALETTRRSSPMNSKAQLRQSECATLQTVAKVPVTQCQHYLHLKEQSRRSLREMEYPYNPIGLPLADTMSIGP